MIGNSQIRYHAKKIMEIFSQIIDVVLHRESLDELGLERLGRSHFHYGVKPTDFKVRNPPLNNFNIILMNFEN